MTTVQIVILVASLAAAIAGLGGCVGLIKRAGRRDTAGPFLAWMTAAGASGCVGLLGGLVALWLLAATVGG